MRVSRHRLARQRTRDVGDERDFRRRPDRDRRRRRFVRESLALNLIGERYEVTSFSGGQAASMGTVVSSPWIFSAANTCRRIVTTIGSSSKAVARPIAQGRAVEIETTPGIDLALPIKRQIVAVLRDQQVRERARRSAAARGRHRWRRCLGDDVAGLAGVLRPDMTDRRCCCYWSRPH
jgi:hypothetical protein